MSRFIESELETLLDTIIDYRGKTPKKLKGEWVSFGIPALSAKNIKKGRIVNQEAIRYVDKDLYSRWMKEEVRKGDILMTSEAPLGETFYVKNDDKLLLSQRLFAIRTRKEKLDSQFLYYYFNSKFGKHELLSRATGTTVGGIRQTALVKVLVRYPENIDTQKNISSVLSTYDNLIENNEKRIKTIEQMAKLLYAEWFENNPEAKNAVKISDIADVASGLSYKREHMVDAGIPLLTMGVVSPKFRFKYDNLKFYNPDYFEKKYATKPGEIVVCSHDVTSDRLILGAPAIVPKDIGDTIMVGTNLYAVVAKNEKYKLLLYHEMLTRRYRNYMISRAKGTNILFINKSDVSGYTFNIPSEEVIDGYFDKVAPIDDEISNLLLRNRVLSYIRDLLIPQLVTGKRELQETI